MTETPEQRAKEFIETAIERFGDRDPGLVSSFLAIAELIRQTEQQAFSRGAADERQAVKEWLEQRLIRMAGPTSSYQEGKIDAVGHIIRDFSIRARGTEEQS